MLSLSPDWVWLVSGADPRLHSVSPRPERPERPCEKPCKTFSNMHNANVNKSCIVSKLHKARNTCCTYKEAVMLFLLNCTGPRCQVQGTWLKAGFSSRTASERNASEVFPCTLPPGRGRRGNGFHFGDCFFMTWQSYCCRWGQRKGTRGRQMLLWVFVSDCASVGPSMLCCVKSGGGVSRPFCFFSLCPVCLIGSSLSRPGKGVGGGGGWKTTALTNVNIIKSLFRLTVGAE